MQNKMLRIIVDHAHLSKLRPLTVYWIGKGSLSQVYSYDIIIPKRYKIDEVSTSIIETSKINESNFIEKEKENNVFDLFQKLKDFEQTNLTQENSEIFSQTSDQVESERIDEQMKQILSHPLVYSDLSALVMDLRFKSFLNLELK